MTRSLQPIQLFRPQRLYQISEPPRITPLMPGLTPASMCCQFLAVTRRLALQHACKICSKTIAHMSQVVLKPATNRNLLFLTLHLSTQVEETSPHWSQQTVQLRISYPRLSRGRHSVQYTSRSIP